MRADRLISILLLLQRRNGLKTRELAEMLEVSERTVLRDMEALGIAGIPVYAQRGSRGGWYLSEGYRTNLNGLNREELQALLLAPSPRIMNDLGAGKAYEGALLKLLSAMPESYRKEAENVRERIHVDGAGWYRRDEPLPHLRTVQEAVWAERKLLFEYVREDGRANRLVEPLGLVVKGNVWYLVASADGELRTYRISRIAHAIMTDQSFVRPESFNLAEYWSRSLSAFRAALPQYPVALKLAKSAIPRLNGERFVHVKDMNPLDEKSVVVRADFETAESACRVILAYGPDAVVLEPGELRERLRSVARAILSGYED